MSSSTRFRTVGALTRGYGVEQVDAFLARALDGKLSSQDIRTVGFDLKFGGYEVAAVDAVLDELEDKALTRERESQRRGLGDRGYAREVTGQAQVLRARLARPHGDRFARGSVWERSYDVEQVDLLMDEVSEYFAGATNLTSEHLRSAVFAPRRGARGYSERAVDRFIDRVIGVLGRVG